jgi:hypothetical protein
MRRAIAVLTFTAVLATAAASFTVLPEDQRVGGADAMFLVPASDGYGVGNCLAAGGECGQLVADAWCQAHGYSRAARFGPTLAEDVTGAVEPVSSESRERPVTIACTR